MTSSKGRGVKENIGRTPVTVGETTVCSWREGRGGEGEVFLVLRVLGVEVISGERTEAAMWMGPRLYSSAKVEGQRGTYGVSCFTGSPDD